SSIVDLARAQTGIAHTPWRASRCSGRKKTTERITPPWPDALNLSDYYRRSFIGGALGRDSTLSFLCLVIACVPPCEKLGLTMRRRIAEVKFRNHVACPRCPSDHK